jgi:hypothetical protein
MPIQGTQDDHRILKMRDPLEPTRIRFWLSASALIRSNGPKSFETPKVIKMFMHFENFGPLNSARGRLWSSASTLIRSSGPKPFKTPKVIKMFMHFEKLRPPQLYSGQVLADRPAPSSAVTDLSPLKAEGDHRS